MFHVKQHPTATPNVSRETTQRLATYVELLLRWNKTINLISRRDEPTVWTRHVADSLALIPHLPADISHIIDIGSGGGFPGIVLAIATMKPFHLIESDQRKAAFLREAARATGANITVHAKRVEDAKPPPASVITARALAPLPLLLEWATPLLLPDGCCLFPKGRSVDDELTQARGGWHMHITKIPSALDPEACILKVSEIARAKPSA